MQIFAGVAAVVIPVVGIVVALLNGWIGTINSNIESLDQRIVEMDNRLIGVQLDVRGLSDTLGVIPSPQSSLLWMSLNVANLPFSGYSETDETWKGVFPEFSEKWREEIGFPEIQFLPSPTAENLFSVAEFDYFVTILSKDDPISQNLISHGWSLIPLDGYFSTAGYGPFGYNIIVSPRSVQGGASTILYSSLDRLQPTLWEDWGKSIEENLP